MLKVEGVAHHILQPVNLALSSKECVAIIGPSGCGKSLLLRAIADLDPHDGHVTLDGQDCADMSPAAWRRQILYVPSVSGWWRETVGEHFPDRGGAAQFIEQLALSEDSINWRVDRLSTGERQRLALARAFCRSPRVLLLDEPTAALDPENAMVVEGLILEFLRRGGASILVTHSLEQAQRVAQRIYRMNCGKIVSEG